MAEQAKEKLTLSDLKSLIASQVKEAVESEGYIRLKDLQEKITESLKSVVDKDLRPAFDAEIKRLSKLPGPDGKANIFGDGVKGVPPNGGYDCFAAFAKDVYLAGMKETPGVSPSPVFRKWCADIQAFRDSLADITRAASPSMEIGDPEQGGYLVPPEFSNQLLSLGFTNSNFIDLCTKIPMERNTVGIPYTQDFSHASYLFGNMQAYWLAEKGQKTGSKPKFGRVTLNLNKLTIMIYSTDELLEDSAISMEPFLTDKTGQVFGWKIDEAILRGTGAGQPRGIIGAPCTLVESKEGGQAAATIQYENIVKMFSRMHPSSLKNAVWIVNSNTFPQLATMSLAVGAAGAPAWMPANGLSGVPYDSLMGRKLIWSEHCSSLGTVGDIILADFSQYLVGQKRGIGAGVQFAKSIHLYFDYDQTAFRFVMRLDGQPWWPSVFTPKAGSTQSCFVTLETR